METLVETILRMAGFPISTPSSPPSVLKKLRQLIIVCAKSIHPFVEIQYEALVFLEGVSGAAASINQRSTYETSVSLPKQSRRRRRPRCSLIWMQGWRQLAVLAVLAILAILTAAMQPRSWSIRELPAEA